MQPQLIQQPTSPQLSPEQGGNFSPTNSVHSETFVTPQHPKYTPEDHFLSRLRELGIVNAQGLINSERIPGPLPPLSENKKHELISFLWLEHEFLTTNQKRLISLSIGQLINSVLSYEGAVTLIGGAVFSYLDTEYIKDFFDSLDPTLYKDLPQDAFKDISKKPNDYDIRIHLHQEESLENIRIRIIAAITNHFYGAFTTPNQAAWNNLYKTVEKTMFQKLHTVNHPGNRFVISTLANGGKVVDLLWTKEARPFLFSKDAINIPLHDCQPTGDVALGYQALIDRLTKRFHVFNATQVDHKGWPLMVLAQTTLHCCMTVGAEKILVETTLSTPTKGKDRVEWLTNLITLCWSDHLGKDPKAALLYKFSLCTSLYRTQHRELIPQIWDAFTIPFQMDPFSSILCHSAPFEMRLAILQIFGLFRCHDKLEIYLTENEEAPALQFRLPSAHKTYSLLLPLNLKEAIQTDCDDSLIDEAIAYFLPETFLEDPLPELEQQFKQIKDELNHPGKLFFLLQIFYTVKTRDFSFLENILKTSLSFPQHFGLVEQLLSLCSKEEKKLLDGDQFFSSLFSYDDPFIARLAFQIANDLLTQEKKERLAHEIVSKHPIYAIQFLSSSQEEVNAHFCTMLSWLNTVHNRYERLQIQTLLGVYANHQNVTDTKALTEFTNTYLKEWGYQPVLRDLITDDNRLKICRLVLKDNPEHALDIWLDGNREDQIVLFEIVDTLKTTTPLKHLNVEKLQPNQQKKVQKLLSSTDDDDLLIIALQSMVLSNNWSQAAKLITDFLKKGVPEKHTATIKVCCNQLMQTNVQETVSLLLNEKISLIYSPEELFRLICEAESKKTALVLKGLKCALDHGIEIPEAFVAKIGSTKFPKEYQGKLADALIRQGKLSELNKLSLPLTKEQVPSILKLQGVPRQLIERNLSVASISVYQKEYTEIVNSLFAKNEWDEAYKWIELLITTPVGYPIDEWIEKFDLPRRIPLLLKYPNVCQDLAKKCMQSTEVSNKERLQLMRTYRFNDMSLWKQMLNHKEAFQQVWKAFRQMAKPVKASLFLDCWLLGLKKMEESRSPAFADFITGKETLPPFFEQPEHRQYLIEATTLLFRGALSLIKNPQKEVHLLSSILKWRKKHAHLERIHLYQLIQNLAKSQSKALVTESAQILHMQYDQLSMQEVIDLIECICMHAQNNIVTVSLLLCYSNLDKKQMTTDQKKQILSGFNAIHYPDPVFEGLTLFDEMLNDNIPIGRELCVQTLKGASSIDNVPLLLFLIKCLQNPQLEKELRKEVLHEHFTNTIKAVLISAHTSNNSIYVHKALYHFFSHFEKLSVKKCLPHAFDCTFSIMQEELLILQFALFLKKLSLKEEEMTLQSHLYFREAVHDYNYQPPTKLPSKQKDFLFSFMTQLMGEILQKHPQSMDQGRSMIIWVGMQLKFLCKYYPQNSVKLAPLLYRYIFTGLESGLDLSKGANTFKWDLIQFANSKKIFREHPRYYGNCMMLLMQESFKIKMGVEEFKQALDHVLEFLSQHPSNMAIHRYCYVINNFLPVFYLSESGASNFLNKGMILMGKDPFCKEENQTAMEAVFDVIQHIMDSANRHDDLNFKSLPVFLYISFIGTLCEYYGKDPTDELYSAIINYKDQALQSSLLKNETQNLLIMMNDVYLLIFLEAAKKGEFDHQPALITKTLVEASDRILEKGTEKEEEFLIFILGSTLFTLSQFDGPDREDVKSNLKQIDQILAPHDSLRKKVNDYVTIKHVQKIIYE